jgi:3-isopropylmalate/(R)-2-methylmalate dehydratase small subunit
MEPFKTLNAVAAPLPTPNLDTDQIIPARFLWRKRTDGWGHLLFNDLRFDDAGSPRPKFVLNRPEFPDPRILVAGRNFGCGSSREHAAWALEDHGFRVVLAPSFGDIFRQNAINSGLAPIALEEDALARVKDAVARRNELTVDLETREIAHPDGLRIVFELDPYVQETLVEGLDDVARTLRREDEIAAFEATYAPRFLLARIS